MQDADAHAPKITPPPRGPALPEADDYDDDDDDNPNRASAASGVLGGLDPDDLQITIDTLKLLAKDLTIFRSRPLMPLV